MLKKAVQFPFPYLIFFFFYLQIITLTVIGATAFDDHREDISSVGQLVRKDQRLSLFSTEDGDISAVEISDGARGYYHLQFITLEPNALFLPVLLHADMVFYVHTGSGRLSWVDGDVDEMRRVNVRGGDVYRLQPGTVFFVQSSLEPERQKLRIYAIFTNSIEDLHEPPIGAYSSIRDLFLGFDKKVLQAAFKVPEDVIEEITKGTIQPAIVHTPPRKERTFWDLEAQFMKALLGSKGYSMFDASNKKHKTKTFNLLKAKPDFENCYGRSLTVTKKDLSALRGSNIGLFMVNLTRGSMMGPHWNPMASEIAIVIQGQGMVRVVCSSTMNESCKHARFRIEEGDVFAVPRFHPMAQMAFNNDSLIFVGFSTTTKKNHPQYLAGKASVFRTLDKQVVAASFNVTNSTISQLLDAQGESIILDCTSCAEEEEMKMEEEIEKEREEARKREEEEARKREEEKRREEEEARKREEDEAKREEQERRKREEEEEARKREEEEVRRRREEEAKREEEEARREEEEAEKEWRKKEEEEEARKREEEVRRPKEEEAKREEEEARREKEEAEEDRRREEEARRQREREAKTEEEKATRREEEEAEEEEERRQREREAKREEEEAEEEEAAEREEEEARRQEEEWEEMERRREKTRRERERQEEEEERGERRRQEEEEQDEEQQEERGEPKRVLKKMWKV